MNVTITAHRSDYMDNTTTIERKIINRLLRAALDAGYSVSVFDGEETTLRNSKRIVQIQAALATTGEDLLTITGRSGEMLGKIFLVYNGDEDVINDHSANDTIRGLVNYALSSY
jgi:hypothetical protein